MHKVNKQISEPSGVSRILKLMHKRQHDLVNATRIYVRTNNMVWFTNYYRSTSIVFLLGILMTGCYMNVYRLPDGRTVVPKETKAYKNKEKFDPAILNSIDTAVFYEEINSEKKLPERLVSTGYHSKYLMMKFYPNGSFNIFSFWKDSALSVSGFDPNYTGHRGIYYEEDNEIKYDEFAAIDQLQHMGKISGTFSFSGDTLSMNMYKRKGKNPKFYPAQIYIKRKLPTEYFNYKPSW